MHQFFEIFEPRYDNTNKVAVRPAKTQISLGIRPVWSESSLCAQWVAKDLVLLHADSEDSDQTGRMPRLIWIFAERTAILLVLSCRGLYFVLIESEQLLQCLWFVVQYREEDVVIILFLHHQTCGLKRTDFDVSGLQHKQLVSSKTEILLWALAGIFPAYDY